MKTTGSVLRQGAGNQPEIVTLVVHVRYKSDAYIARCKGKTASCTFNEEVAVRRAAQKAATVIQDILHPDSTPEDFDIVKTGDGLFHVHCGPLWKGKGAKR